LTIVADEDSAALAVILSTSFWISIPPVPSFGELCSITFGEAGALRTASAAVTGLVGDEWLGAEAGGVFVVTSCSSGCLGSGISSVVGSEAVALADTG
jgi:hypothetical protein